MGGTNVPATPDRAPGFISSLIAPFATALREGRKRQVPQPYEVTTPPAHDAAVPVFWSTQPVTPVETTPMRWQTATEPVEDSDWASPAMELVPHSSHAVPWIADAQPSARVQRGG